MSQPNEPSTEKPKSSEKGLHELFRRFAAHSATLVGSSAAFGAAVCLIVLWALSYPLFRLLPNAFDTWQLVINTATTIITFVMVFLIQNSQNRDARAVHLKLDELIRAIKGARNRMVDLEDCTDEELEKLQGEFVRLRNERSTDRNPAPAPADETN